MLDAKYQPIFDRHMPKGYRFQHKKMTRYYGYVTNDRAIYLHPDETGRNALYTFLHECGHVHSQHCRTANRELPAWREEYEADQYAIRAMRAEGVPVPRKKLAERKSVLRGMLEAVDEPIDEEVLRFAYGRHWRKHGWI